MLTVHTYTLATIRANGFALVACLACTLWYPGLALYAGWPMADVVDWITLVGVVMGVAAGGLVWWSLKSQGAFPVWIYLYFAVDMFGNVI